ncbi:MAG: aldo/keto reductase, partial [Eubacteriaceae bacterium]|nr:aldo/keto reductase [Eubacteriaceae bacterium]
GFTEFLDSAIKDGRIKYAGFSFHDKLDLFKEVVDYYDWSFCQIQYNYLDEIFQAGTEGLEYAAAKGLGIVIMEPIRGGKLADHLPEDVLDLFNQANSERTPASWALRWVWDRPEVSVVLSGMNAMSQLTDNLQTADEAEVHSLTKEEIETIDQVKAALKDRIKVNCTACGYCMPCPHGVDIPTCFAMYNNYHMFGVEEGYNMRMAPQQKASACVECGLCVPNCPQGIEIPEELKKVKAVFE